MAVVHFYEKPGCINNTRQKQLLLEAGHIVFAYDVLQQPWAQKQAELRSFFGDLPVADWFNGSAPAIKTGEVIPGILSESQAIALMAAYPLLIRRPLLEVDGRRRAGFDAEHIEAWLNIDVTAAAMEACPKRDSAHERRP